MAEAKISVESEVVFITCGAVCVVGDVFVFFCKDFLTFAIIGGVESHPASNTLAGLFAQATWWWILSLYSGDKETIIPGYQFNHIPADLTLVFNAKVIDGSRWETLNPKRHRKKESSI